MRAAALSLSGRSRQDASSGRQDRLRERVDEGHEGKARQQRQRQRLHAGRQHARDMQRPIDQQAARGGRERADKEHSQGGQETAPARGVVDRRIARHETQREVAPADAERRGDAEGEPQQEQDAERRIPRETLDRIPRDDAQCAEVARKVVRRRHPEVGAEDAVGPLEQRAGEGGAAAVAHLGGQLLGLDQDGAGQPLRLVEFGDGALPLGAVAGDIGALVGVVLLGLGAELFEPRLGGVAFRREVADEGAQALGDRIDPLADP